MIYIVISKTPKSGKSTIASQLIVPYIYKDEKKPITITQICNRNIDYISYSQSSIIKHEMINNSNWEKLDKVFEREEDVVLDVNLEHNIKLLNYLEKNEINKDEIVFFIPITDRVDEMKNLETLLTLIQKRVKEPNIILSFNRVSNLDEAEFQYFNIYGYKNLGIKGLENIENYDKIFIKYDPIINICNKFNSLVVDFVSEENIKRTEREETYFNNKLIQEVDEDKKELLFQKIDVVIAKKKLINRAILFAKQIENIL